MIFPVILSGGSGSRLWPVSREHYPKQFLNLHKDDRSLLQEAAERLKNVESAGAPLVVCNEEHRFLVAEQMHQIGLNNTQIILGAVWPQYRTGASVSRISCTATQ